MQKERDRGPGKTVAPVICIGPLVFHLPQSGVFVGTAAPHTGMWKEGAEDRNRRRATWRVRRWRARRSGSCRGKMDERDRDGGETAENGLRHRSREYISRSKLNLRHNRAPTSLARSPPLPLSRCCSLYTMVLGPANLAAQRLSRYLSKVNDALCSLL